MSSLETIKGIGPKMKKKLNHNNIYDCFAIINHFPSKYEIYSLIELKDVIDKKRVTLEGKVTSRPIVRYIRKNFNRISFNLSIENRIFKVYIFNRDYLKNILDIGVDIVVTGTIDRLKNTFTATTLKLKKNFKNEIEPIYNIDTISDHQFNKFAQSSIKLYAHLIKDELPTSLIKKYRLITYQELLRIVHNPITEKDLFKIDRRIKYEELFKFQFKIQYLKLKNKSKKNTIKKYDINEIKKFISDLPFELTNDQKSVTNEIIKDIKSPYIMNRLLQGDTGCGKTVVAAITILSVLSSGYQVALMAPTEILAKQHYKIMSQYFINTKYQLIYLSGKLTQSEKNQQLKIIKENSNVLIIGTHALFSENVIYNKLGYVITDEQHRFGVIQRRKLREKGFNPDVLYMSATPIPRTLAISLFGEMDISTIKEKPKNRTKVATKLFTNNQIDLVYLLVAEELKLNHQVYVVTPLILESEKLDLSNAQKVYKEFSSRFKDYYVGLLHSKIKKEEKDQVMKLFEENKINILVSTTIIEVGVDIPNATLMIVLDSERFGLSQLHQLRGRIGRSSLKSYCLLLYNDTEKAKEKLEIFEKTDDGFILSEEDLKLRGPGDFFGYRQSGDMKFQKASIVEDTKILEIAREDALRILTNKNSYQDKEFYLIFNYLRNVLRKSNLD